MNNYDALNKKFIETCEENKILSEEKEL